MDKHDVDVAFQNWINTFGRNAQKREDAKDALDAAKNMYADGDKKRKQEIDAYVKKKLEDYLG